MYNISNRRYMGSKYKLLDWIEELILENCEGESFFDVKVVTYFDTKWT